MIFNVGYLILVTALLLALFGVVAGLWGGRQRSTGLTESSFHAIYAVAGLLLVLGSSRWMRKGASDAA